MKTQSTDLRNRNKAARQAKEMLSEPVSFWRSVPTPHETGVLEIISATQKGPVARTYHVDFLTDHSAEDGAGMLLGYRLSYDGGRKFYDVTFTSFGLSCDCPDHLYKRDGRDPQGCKHCRAVRQHLVVPPSCQLPAAPAAPVCRPVHEAEFA